MAHDSPILLPIDGSESSLRAAQHCAVIAKALGAPVFVLNVQPEIEEWQTHGLGRDAAESHLAERAKRALGKAVAVLDVAGVPHESLYEMGDVPDTIARVATEKGCGQVIMGTRGQSELKSRLMGAVGMKVIHLLEIPITYVR